ncbi:transporter substrate-binding domain-containing protein [Paracidovorax cattleyae]|uniref:Amino acid ABC transporter substrate-binding protein, PAAT family n=1 Tax=Paracidovorax cattleyae TaxID=80868 RepID=A0A1H0M9H1_9BURK|nr:transporter substrate-binding domain-containing protein [Paracidovorax cattleyae]AVS74179.1 ABC transporter substrate-binding protein [Paracidovorax cattleyae]MBF9264301.1 transporter substrate-binding domain-containing protein [Paracidovorax cattleyae]SDO77112.1 amino acid ABC transporter substrate-binding protein, PAAT family [Paracidovorax cattleyae]
MTLFAYIIEPPFNDLAADGSLTGCDVEVARTVLQVAGLPPFQPVETTFAELLPGLAAGRWRMTTGLFVTEQRQRQVSFSRPIWALADGLLVAQGNPLALDGYRSVALDPDCRLAVVRDQIQHRTAHEDFAIPAARIQLYDSYAEAAGAVSNGRADAYASVARAHAAFALQNPAARVQTVVVAAAEKPPAFGAFAFARNDGDLRQRVDAVLDRYLGSPEHRRMLGRFGFTDREIDLVV